MTVCKNNYSLFIYTCEMTSIGFNFDIDSLKKFQAFSYIIQRMTVA